MPKLMQALLAFLRLSCHLIEQIWYKYNVPSWTVPRWALMHSSSKLHSSQERLLQLLGLAHKHVLWPKPLCHGLQSLRQLL